MPTASAKASCREKAFFKAENRQLEGLAYCELKKTGAQRKRWAYLPNVVATSALSPPKSTDFGGCALHKPVARVFDVRGQFRINCADKNRDTGAAATDAQASKTMQPGDFSLLAT